MKRMTCEITITNNGDFKEFWKEISFNQVVDIEIESSWETFTDTCKLSISNVFNLADGYVEEMVFETAVDLDGSIVRIGTDDTQLVANVVGSIHDEKYKFKRGDGIVVKCGYNAKNVEVFNGYIANITYNRPILIECEDKMYLLKKKIFNKSFKKVSLKEIIAYLCKDVIEYKVDLDIDLGSYRLINATAVQIFDDLKKLGIYTFIRGGVLHSGFPNVWKEDVISTLTSKMVNNLFQQAGLLKNYISVDEITENNLVGVVRSESDYSVKVKNMNTLTKDRKDKKTKEADVTYGTGETERTLHTINATKEQQILQAKQFMNRLINGLYEGSITVFGNNEVSHGDAITIEDSYNILNTKVVLNGYTWVEYEYKLIRFVVKKVTTTFGESGYRKQIELDYCLDVITAQTKKGFKNNSR
jgi:hypothetical protein